MSSALNMSLDDSIKKSKGGDRKGGPAKRGGFKKPFGRREGGDSFRGKRGDRRGGRGGRRFDRDGDRDRERSFRGGRGRFDRERGPRNFREGREKREDEGRSNRPEKVAIKRRAIFKTGLRTTKPRVTETTEVTVRQQERPVSERRRLRVSNLDFNITHKDLMELFSKLGTITKNKIEYDDLGRSKGTAMIEYEKHEGAIKAMKEYDGAVLDGKTISVEFDDDVKAKSGGSNLVRKVITKEPRYEEREVRRYDDRDRERNNRDRDDDRRYKSFRSDRDRGDRGDREDRGFRGDRGDRRDRGGFRGGFRGSRGGFRGGDRNRGFRSNRRD